LIIIILIASKTYPSLTENAERLDHLSAFFYALRPPQPPLNFIAIYQKPPKIQIKNSKNYVDS